MEDRQMEDSNEALRKEVRTHRHTLKHKLAGFQKKKQIKRQLIQIKRAHAIEFETAKQASGSQSSIRQFYSESVEERNFKELVVKMIDELRPDRLRRQADGRSRCWNCERQVLTISVPLQLHGERDLSILSFV